MADTVCKITKYKEFSVKPFKRVKIGDPSYFKSGSGIRYTFDEDLPEYKEYGVRLALQHMEMRDPAYKSLSCDTWILMMYAQNGKEDELLQSCFDGVYNYPEKRTAYTDLGCDTASYMIWIDGTSQVMYNGEDGYYGCAMMYGKDGLFYAEASMPDDMTTEDKMLDAIRFLFNVTEESTWIML